jgi:hypothetical protein
VIVAIEVSAIHRGIWRALCDGGSAAPIGSAHGYRSPAGGSLSDPAGIPPPVEFGDSRSSLLDIEEQACRNRDSGKTLLSI